MDICVGETVQFPSGSRKLGLNHVERNIAETNEFINLQNTDKAKVKKMKIIVTKNKKFIAEYYGFNTFKKACNFIANLKGNDNLIYDYERNCLYKADGGEVLLKEGETSFWYEDFEYELAEEK